MSTSIGCSHLYTHHRSGQGVTNNQWINGFQVGRIRRELYIDFIRWRSFNMTRISKVIFHITSPIVRSGLIFLQTRWIFCSYVFPILVSTFRRHGEHTITTSFTQVRWLVYYFIRAGWCFSAFHENLFCPRNLVWRKFSKTTLIKFT